MNANVIQKISELCEGLPLWQALCQVETVGRVPLLGPVTAKEILSIGKVLSGDLPEMPVNLARLLEGEPELDALAEELAQVVEIAGFNTKTPLQNMGASVPMMLACYGLRSLVRDQGGTGFVWDERTERTIVDQDDVSARTELESQRGEPEAILACFKAVWDQEIAERRELEEDLEEEDVDEDEGLVVDCDWDQVFDEKIGGLVRFLGTHHSEVFFQDLTTYWKDNALNERFILIYARTGLGNVVGSCTYQYHNV